MRAEDLPCCFLADTVCDDISTVFLCQLRSSKCDESEWNVEVFECLLGRDTRSLEAQMDAEGWLQCGVFYFSTASRRTGTLNFSKSGST
jgi:hypothetical protein